MDEMYAESLVSGQGKDESAPNNIKSNTDCKKCGISSEQIGPWVQGLGK